MQESPLYFSDISRVREQCGTCFGIECLIIVHFVCGEQARKYHPPKVMIGKDDNFTVEKILVVVGCNRQQFNRKLARCQQVANIVGNRR